MRIHQMQDDSQGPRPRVFSPLGPSNHTCRASSSPILIRVLHWGVVLKLPLRIARKLQSDLVPVFTICPGNKRLDRRLNATEIEVEHYDVVAANDYPVIAVLFPQPFWIADDKLE